MRLLSRCGLLGLAARSQHARAAVQKPGGAICVTTIAECTKPLQTVSGKAPTRRFWRDRLFGDGPFPDTYEPPAGEGIAVRFINAKRLSRAFFAQNGREILPKTTGIELAAIAWREAGKGETCRGEAEAIAATLAECRF
jgi:hypothetical protein